MRRFLTFRKTNHGSHADEGEISVAVDGIVALESTSGTGNQLTTITLSGGRAIIVKGSLEKTKAAIRSPRSTRTTEPLSDFDRVFGRGFARDFFGLRRRP